MSSDFNSTGLSISLFAVFENETTPAGAWSIDYADIAIISTDGTVTQVNGAPDGGELAGDCCSKGNPTAAWGAYATAGTPSALDGAHFYLADHLGTTQLEMASGGWPVWHGQFAPFGGELQNGAALPPTTPDGSLNHYKFTGKERDAESGLDYFGARYCGSSMGRFMSPDWAAKAMPVPYVKLDNPQSLNLYAYVNNNPLRTVDKDGHSGDACANSSAQQCSVSVDAKNKTATVTETNRTVTNNKDASGNVVSTTVQTTTTNTTVTTGSNAHVEGATQTTSSTTVNADGTKTSTPTQTVELNTNQLIQQNPGRVSELTSDFSPTLGERAMDHKVGIGGTALGGGAAIGCALAEPCGATVVVVGVLFGAGAAIYDMVTH